MMEILQHPAQPPGATQPHAYEVLRVIAPREYPQLGKGSACHEEIIGPDLRAVGGVLKIGHIGVGPALLGVFCQSPCRTLYPDLAEHVGVKHDRYLPAFERYVQHVSYGLPAIVQPVPTADDG